uniref:Reeler domain containing 1 n=1 Tax=Haplochromis burtoni TaxID=8153 RepID=A0A3Q2VDA5_HAPBU
MLSTLHCLGVCAVLFLLAPHTTSFSGGASHASCQEMIPGHIRAHSQDSQHRQVTIRTSASSYLPGQFITVMVRSSRDFMGFLLQARRSRRQGPLLVGGSWILTPPGTHTLCCLSEGDTVTHSDKQLKRNLSFVWRAPDSPVGDIRFYITVVQSYFVYWAGIESGLVRDKQKQTPSSESLFNPLLFTLRTDQTPILEKSQVDLRSDAKIRTTRPVFALPSATPSLSASSFSFSNTLLPTATVNDRSTNSPHSSGGLLLVTMRASIRSTFVIPSSFTRNQLTTSSARFALPSPSPISNPPYLSSSQPTPTSPQPSSFASSTIPYLYTSNHPSSDLLFTPAPLPTFTSSQCITNSTNSSISFVSSTTSSSSTSATSSSYQGTSFYIPSVTSPPAAQATSLHSGPSPAPRRSLHNLSMPSPSQKHTEGHTASSDPDPNKEGKYPDIRRHSAWELGMLLGSSAGLGMVLVVGIRYLYRQACGKRTAVTLNDREREYGRGEIGLIHVQECGDLVRVRKIRENSLVLLAEYDVLSPPGERNAGCQQR